MLSVAPKSMLVSALCSCAEVRRQSRTRRFLEGLSSDELQYIAEFLGACILEAQRRCVCTRAQLAESIERFEGSRTADAPGHGSPVSLRLQEHKMILLLEYLCRSGRMDLPARVGTGPA